MSDQLIRTLLEARLNTWAGSRVPALKVAWENVAFAPPSGFYLHSFLRRGPTYSRDLAGDNRRRFGVHQINVVNKAGSGSGAHEAIAAELATLFPMGLLLTSGQFWMQQTSPVRVWNGYPDEENWVVPVDYEYTSDYYPA